MCKTQSTGGGGINPSSEKSSNKIKGKHVKLASGIAQNGIRAEIKIEQLLDPEIK